MYSSPAPKAQGGAATPGSSGRPNRDTMLKVTFSVKHDVQDPTCAMYVTGSLPSLGSWEPQRARKMAGGDDGVWNLAIYIPERAEFLYQYLLIKDDSDEPYVVWEGGIERKCKLADALSTPNKACLLRDDARGESGGQALSATPIRADKPTVREGKDQMLALKEAEIDTLIEERERCSNELQKMKDILGFSEAPDEYKKRCSYLPDQGPLYDTVRQLQATIRTQILDRQCKTIREEGPSAEEVAQALEKEKAEHDICKKQLAEMAASIASLEKEFKAEKEELRDYYERSLGEMDGNHQKVAAQREKDEQMRTMLQTNIRVAAGELHSVKQEFGSLKEGALALHEAIMPSLCDISDQICEQIAVVTQGIETNLTTTVEKYKKEVVERKRLHNVVQELKGNIRVFARSRPLSGKEGERGAVECLTFSSDTEMLLDNAGKLSTFQYDAVFGTESTQETVFNETQPLVVSVLDGYNVCIFAYGQTGSGKTFTMQGYGDNPGVNPRALQELFSIAGDRAGAFTYELSVSLLEIYNENIRDLIEPQDEKGSEKKLEVKIAQEGGTYVPTLAVVAVHSMDDVTAVLSMGERHRTVGRTNMNEHSSRSHMILTVSVKSTNVMTGTKAFGKLHLIDLAGSERIAKSGAQGDRLKEAQNINKSLSALGDCVQSLVSKSKHVPFRNSKLTHLLQDSLGGESKALMFVCVSPSDNDSGETLCSLNFAARVRNVELGPAKRKGGSDPIMELKLKDKDREIEALREAARNADASAKNSEARARSLSQKLKEEAEERQNSSRQTEADESDRLKELQEQIVHLKDALDEANRKAETGHQEVRWAKKRDGNISVGSSFHATPRKADESPLPHKRQAVGSGVKPTPKRREVTRPFANNTLSNTPEGKSEIGLTLDERLERIRSKKREAQADQENAPVHAYKRPQTAPTRPIGTRLGSGASRVVRNTDKDRSTPKEASTTSSGRRVRAAGGWR